MKYIVECRIHQRWLKGKPRDAKKESSWLSTVTIDASSIDKAKQKAKDYFSLSPQTEDVVEWVTIDWVLPVEKITKKSEVEELLDFLWDYSPDYYMKYWEPEIGGIEMLRNLMEDDPEYYGMIYRMYKKGR